MSDVYKVLLIIKNAILDGFVRHLKTLTNLSTYVLSWSLSFSQALVFLPIAILFKNVTSLLMLPINVPLGLFFGSSVQSMVQNVGSTLNAYFLITLIQYAIVILIVGCLFGITSGLMLGVVHTYITIPNKYVDITAMLKRVVYGVFVSVSDFWGSLTKNVSQSVFERIPFISYIYDRVKKLFEFDIKKKRTLTSVSSPNSSYAQSHYSSKSEPVGKKEKQVYHIPSLSTREDALKIAKSLPSDFFQKENEYISERGRKNSMQNVYRTPGHSPSRSNDETLNSDLDEAYLNESEEWKKLESIPNTLRSDGGMTTLLSHRNNSFSSIQR